ncbi:hypothetical protein JYU34_015756 [Plutella xylostella]|uniref:Metalloendopeptidase n=1 Tax=Plutella xylostella TaxID=51655 RepID=A0ABQ7Q8F0_PLUXY|nr:hypothetical protein JYU34_015756 [Plutella xylostella]
MADCCLSFYDASIAGAIMRKVLITPTCSLATEVAHATLHGLGLSHERGKPIPEERAMDILLTNNCNLFKTIINTTVSTRRNPGNV